MSARRHPFPDPPGSRRLWLFAREAFRSFRQVGTFLPAQPHLARQVAQTLPRHPGVTLVELGAGEGCLTRAIVRQMNGLNYRLLVIELNEPLLQANRQSVLHETYRQNIPPSQAKLTFHREDALHLATILRREGVTKVDAIVSSLPIFFFSHTQRRRLLETHGRVLDSDGLFIQYRYSPQGAHELKEFFPEVARRFVWNVLPAWLFTCRNRPLARLPSS